MRNDWNLLGLVFSSCEMTEIGCKMHETASVWLLKNGYFQILFSSFEIIEIECEIRCKMDYTPLISRLLNAKENTSIEKFILSEALYLLE